MMNQAMAQAITEPVVVSMRCRTMSDSSAFLSTTLFCARKIIHGAVVMMMNQAMAQAITEPVVVSMRCRTMSDSSAFLSTTLFCARKIIHGAMVVPMVATSSET